MDGFLRVENPDFDWADMSVDDGYEFAASVGSYPANDYGLYDMGGNVSEWGQDWFAHDYYTPNRTDYFKNKQQQQKEWIEKSM